MFLSTREGAAFAAGLASGARENILVDNVPVRPMLAGGWKKHPFCPGWMTANGYLADEKAWSSTVAKLVAFEVHQHDSGLTLADLYHTSGPAQTNACVVELLDIALRFELYPGAGYALTWGTPLPIEEYATGVPPQVTDEDRNGRWYPDVIYTGQAGSPRNLFVPAFFDCAKDLRRLAHGTLFGAFQVMRPIQRVNSIGELAIGVWWDPSKTWTKRAFPVYDRKYGERDVVLDGYSTNHVEVAELACLFLALRDPRSYRQLKALALAFLRWDWYCGDGGDESKIGRGSIPYDNNSRMKGRSLILCAWAFLAAHAAGDQEFKDYVALRAAAHVAKIAALWDGKFTPSATAPDGRHLSVPWDATWMVSLIGWGAALCSRWMDTPGASPLANRVADWLERLFDAGPTFGKPGALPIDVPASGIADLGGATWYYPPGAPEAKNENILIGTASWCSHVLRAVGGPSPLLDALRAAGEHYHYPLVDSTPVIEFGG